MRYLKSQLQREIRGYFRNKNIKLYTHVYAEINGTPMYLNEIEVRYLQVKCRQEAEAGRFEEFTRTHIVYSGPTKRKNTPMLFRSDGNFVTKFRSGFYDSINTLVFEIV